MSKKYPTAFLYIHNVDNSFVNHDLLYKLLENSLESDLIVPEYKGRGGHPILISEKIINGIRDEKNNQLHFKEYLCNYKMKKINVNDDKILVNINNLDEYNILFK
ncbi:MAG: hypothetical protein A2X13_07310 [Bacteroidetes bacterium GWC2_33_15]|nr:MAG: hypothetical protein A2X10_01165 [Bacteroidetes bacterium GWA2_33_15]OFX48596.1 MAG: hypothetical protein A2X13_07310 [Bacteroidetes bacterium GWC2_33_15]OFX64570.1 MAG: hypothetical protein A2X15_04900 [Bacteroidetes bacterium GWB2_32_14]OFX68012.1 MAG: hypothetical protein A2X14_01875 [Bacteroidetes bacterium GWD2_33_33]HAN18248.1 hypothetical protein [Bacteroidales bacterium]